MKLIIEGSVESGGGGGVSRITIDDIAGNDSRPAKADFNSLMTAREPALFAEIANLLADFLRRGVKPCVAFENHPDTTVSCKKVISVSKGVGAHQVVVPHEKAELAALRSSGFGMEDFVRAIRYPLQHKFALITGAVIYGLLMFAGFRGGVVAWMIMFGCISHVISQVAWGRLNRSFMPDFSDFSLWDDLVLPVFLGVGIMIVSWGPVIALVVALVFGVMSGAGVRASSLVGGNHAAEATGPTAEDLDVLTDPNADPKKLEEANRKLQELRPGTQMAREAESSQAEANDPAGVFRNLVPYLGAGTSIALLFLLLIGW